MKVSFFIVSIRHEWGHTNYGLRERLNGIQEVSGSIPLISTKKKTVIRKDGCFSFWQGREGSTASVGRCEAAEPRGTERSGVSRLFPPKGTMKGLLQIETSLYLPLKSQRKSLENWFFSFKAFSFYGLFCYSPCVTILRLRGVNVSESGRTWK